MPEKFEGQKKIPQQYRQYWVPFKTEKVLLHITKAENWKNIQKTGYLEPHDPEPQHWAGMKAVFLGDPNDSAAPSSKGLSKHVKKTGEKLIRLYIKTSNQLFKSNAPGRAWHVMTLEPISVKDILKTEIVK